VTPAEQPGSPSRSLRGTDSGTDSGTDGPVAGSEPDRPDPNEPLDPMPVPRRGRAGWIKAGFLVLVLAFGALFVVRRWDELVAEFRQMSWVAILAAVVLAALAQVSAMRAYRAILADLGAPLPVPAAGRLYFVGQLGKYLPGTVWVLVGTMALARELRIMRKTSLAASALALVLSIATALIVAAALLPIGAAGSVRRFWYLGLLIPVLLIGLHPKVVGTVLDTGLRLVGRQPMPARLTPTGTLRAAGWQALSWLLFGLHAWLLVIGVGGPVGASLAVSVGGFALAYGIGPLAVVAPAGAGVRETALVLTLGTVVGGTAALAVALVSRVVLVGVDFAQAGTWTLRSRRAGAVLTPVRRS
jgi:glycosyltransferase 2 family protein